MLLALCLLTWPVHRRSGVGEATLSVSGLQARSAVAANTLQYVPSRVLVEIEPGFLPLYFYVS